MRNIGLIPKKFNYLYKTTNLINGKFYIGVHSTDRINDKYIGSGKLLKRAIEKYGRENFKREILYWFDNLEDMYEMEKQIVNEEFVKDKNNYNLSIGGGLCILYGESNGFYGKKHKKETIDNMKVKLSEMLSGRVHIKKGDKFTNIDPKDLDKWIKDGWERGSICEFTIWVNKNGKHKMIKEEEVNYYLENGWERGRKNISLAYSVWINNGELNKRVNPCDVGDYIEKGWKTGHIFNTSDGMLCYNRNGKNKFIKQDEVKEHEKNGWIKGMLRKNFVSGFKGKTHTPEMKTYISKKASENSKGRIWINKEGTTKMIYPNELQDYIQDGWKKGRK